MRRPLDALGSLRGPVHCSAKRLGDLILRLAHADGDLDECVGDGLVGAQLHKLRRHRDAKLLCHLSHLFLLRLSAEGGRQTVQRLLGVHQTLKLRSWVIVLDGALVLDLLLSSLLVSLSNGVVHLSLHLGGLESGLFDGHIVLMGGDFECTRLSQKCHHK